MKTKHTQGEWKAGKPNAETFHVLSNHKFICMLPAKEEQAEANAKLIAASPDLLEALQTCYNWAKNGNKEGLIVFEQALKAIKKATE